MSRVYTDEMKQFIRENVKGITTFQLTDLLNNTFGTNFKRNRIKFLIYDMGLTNGVDTKITRKSRETMPQSKNLGVSNKLPIGSENEKNGYIIVKADNKGTWKYKHVCIYEKHHNVVVNGKTEKIIFLDGNKRNFDIDNLMMISNKENFHMNKNELRFSDKELTKTGLSLAKLNIKIAEMEKRKKD